MHVFSHNGNPNFLQDYFVKKCYMILYVKGRLVNPHNNPLTATNPAIHQLIQARLSPVV